MQSFETLLQGSADAHGHLCPGQVVGVRMAMLGCNRIGLLNPSEMPQIKKLIVYVEIDRCAADAIAYVTGVKLGRRSLKFMDYGIMAATFVNLESRSAFRIVSTESARDLVPAYAPEIDDPRQQQIEAYIRMPDEVLFDVKQVRVEVPFHDMPGPSRFKAACERCGQVVRDKKEILRGGRVLCRPCAQGAYFSPLDRDGADRPRTAATSFTAATDRADLNSGLTGLPYH
jgi:formylmethanofuran dehydrogenase subunit E